MLAFSSDAAPSIQRGGNAFQENGFAAADQRPEPMHFRARVIKRRYAEENVVALLGMVFLLRYRRTHKRLVAVQNGFRKTCGAAGKINRGVILVAEHDIGTRGGSLLRQQFVTVRESRAILAHEKHCAHFVEFAEHRFHPADELLAEHQHGHVGEVEAIFDFVRGVAVVERHGDCARLEYAEIYRQPLQAIHKQNTHFLAALHAFGNQQVGKPVRSFVKLLPRHLAAVLLVRRDLDEGIILPRQRVFLLQFGIYLDKTHFVAEVVRIVHQKIRNRHFISPTAQPRL